MALFRERTEGRNVCDKLYRGVRVRPSFVHAYQIIEGGSNLR